jgi:mono/diheme cytochrome c family protein
MKRHVPALLCALAAAMPVAYAQNAAQPAKQKLTQTRPVTDGLTDAQTLGRQLFAQSCGICHLQPVRGSGSYGPALTKAAAAGNDDVMRAFMQNGTDRMPAFKYYLKPAEMDAIIAYIRTVPAPATPAQSAQK